MEFGFWDYPILGVYMGAMSLLVIYGAHRYSLILLYRRLAGGPAAPPGHFDTLPVVTVQLPLYNERYVAERLIDAACGLEYPRDLLEIQVLDDSTDETRSLVAERVRYWRERGIDIQHVRRDDRSGYKAGALGYGMARARGEFFLLFDADFVPSPRLLIRAIHYFADPKVGMVQMRWGHLNRDYSLLTRLQSIFLDGHFVIEHLVRNRSGRFFNFNGTAGMWRRTAIEAAGGWSFDTLTEDLDLSYRAQMAGWRFVYLPELSAPAELPVEITAFKNQQYRWAKGSVQTARKILPRIWRAELPPSVKVEATVHLMANFAYVLMLIPSVLVLPTMIRVYQTQRLEIALLYAVFFVFATVSVWAFFGLSQKESYGDWRRRVLLFPLLMSLGIGMAVNNAKAVIGGLRGQTGAFVRTPKYGHLLEQRRHRKSDYRSLLSSTVFWELALAGYFAVTLYYALGHAMYGAVPFLLIFFAGFVYVGGLSLWQALRRRIV